MQAILLLVFLVLGFLGYRFLKRGGIATGLTSFINMETPNIRSLESMKDEDKTALQRRFGGFWVHATDNPEAAIQKRDCLELNENGIIWQVIQWRVLFPSGDTGCYYHIRHAYLNPYGVAADKRTTVCEVRTIRQVFIDEDREDTCFGRSQVDELWETRRDDTLFSMNRKIYVPYRGELHSFFPEGQIDLIDKLLMNECVPEMNLTYLVRERLSEIYRDNQESRTCDTVQIKENLIEYFKSAFVDEMFSSIPYFPTIPDSIGLPLQLRFDGSVTLAFSKNRRAQACVVEERTFQELEKWPFPRCDTREMPSITYSMPIPAR